MSTPRKADQPLSEVTQAKDNENGEGGDGNGGNGGGDDSSSSDSSDSSDRNNNPAVEDDHPPEEEKKGQAQPEEEKKRPPRSEHDQLYLSHGDKMEGFAKKHQVAMAAINARAEKAKLSRTVKVLHRSTLRTLRRQKRERKAAMMKISEDIGDQLLESDSRFRQQQPQPLQR